MQTSRGCCSPPTPSRYGGDAAGQRIPARLPRPGVVQLEGPAGRDGALEVVPRGRGRGRRPGSPYRTSRRGREAAAHAGGAGPQDRRPHGPSVGMGASHQQRVSRAVQPVDRRVPASLWRHRLRRGHGAGTRPHVGDGGRGQAARGASELSARYARVFSCSGGGEAAVRRNRPACDAGPRSFAPCSRSRPAPGPRRRPSPSAGG